MFARTYTKNKKKYKFPGEGKKSLNAWGLRFDRSRMDPIRGVILVLIPRCTNVYVLFSLFFSTILPYTLGVGHEPNP